MATKTRIDDSVQRGHRRHVDHDDIAREQVGRLLMRWPKPGQPNISAATTAIHACPSAVRTPARIPGAAAGRMTLMSF